MWAPVPRRSIAAGTSDGGAARARRSWRGRLRLSILLAACQLKTGPFVVPKTSAVAVAWQAIEKPTAMPLLAVARGLRRLPPNGHDARRAPALSCLLGVVGRGHVLRLIRKDAGGARLPQAAQVLRPAGEGQRGQARSLGTIRVAGGYLLAVAVGLVLGMGLGRAFVYPAPEAPTAMYKRSAAFARACEAAGAEIARLRRATFFIDDCSAPIVTPLFGSEGQVIVSRTVEGFTDDDDGGRMIYSVKMDGRGIDKWRALEIKRAPNGLALDASLLPTKRSAMPTSAQR